MLSFPLIVKYVILCITNPLYMILRPSVSNSYQFACLKCLEKRSVYVQNKKLKRILVDNVTCNNNVHVSVYTCTKFCNHINDVMVCMLTSCVVYRGFRPWSGQTKNYKIGICCFSAMHAALCGKNKDW